MRGSIKNYSNWRVAFFSLVKTIGGLSTNIRPSIWVMYFKIMNLSQSQKEEEEEDMFKDSDDEWINV